jgi:hypothetical protein
MPDISTGIKSAFWGEFDGAYWTMLLLLWLSIVSSVCWHVGVADSHAVYWLVRSLSRGLILAQSVSEPFRVALTVKL